jgi:hypothetical protein
MSFTEMLFNELSEGAGVQHLIDFARDKAFQNPIMVTNAAFRIIGLSRERDFDDLVWNEALQMHGFSSETIRSFRIDKESRRLFQEKKIFLYDTGLGKKIPRILAPLESGENVLGYLIIFSVDRPIDEADFKNAEILSQALKIILNGPTAISDIKLSLPDFTLKKLLNGGKVSADQMLEIKKRDIYTTLSISLPSDLRKRHYISYIEERIVNGSPWIHCFPYRQNLFVLMTYDDFEMLHSFYKRIDPLMEEYDIFAGASNHFANLSNLALYYAQAVSLRTIGFKLNPKERIYRFRDYNIYYLISHIDKEQFEPFISTDFKELRAYDAAHSTELLNTLICYYFESMSINRVSKKMHTHRNTIAYRLSSIRTIFQIDFSDMRRIRNIVLSAEIVKWKNLDME